MRESKTRNIKLITCLPLMALMMVIFMGFSVCAEEAEKPAASADIGIFSKYIWRGYELSDNSIVIQPSATISYKGFGFNLWGNLDTDQEGDDDNQFNETDMTFSYDYSNGPISLGVGYIYYGLDGMDDSEELYLCVSYDTLLSPSLTIYREISHLPSWYLSFGISHSIELSEGITLDFAGSVGYSYSDDDDFVEVNDDDKYQNFHDGLLSVGLTVPFSEYFTFCPMIAYSFPLTDEADDLLTATSFSDESDFLFGGATLSIVF